MTTPGVGLVPLSDPVSLFPPTCGPQARSRKPPARSLSANLFPRELIKHHVSSFKGKHKVTYQNTISLKGIVQRQVNRILELVVTRLELITHCQSLL